MSILLLHKPIGLSPAQALEKLKLQRIKYAQAKLGAAGRLDPMAEGLLLVMVNETNKEQAEFLTLPKTYEVELLLGIETDSYDVLGIPRLGVQLLEDIDSDALLKALERFKGQIDQAYPPYSAVQVDGKPLYWWARQNRLDEIQIPTAKRNIFDISALSSNKLNIDILSNFISKRVGLVNGDFRQPEIANAWQELLKDLPINSIPTLSLRIECSSGTYVRSIVHELGQHLGTGATTLRIVRTKIGEFELKNALHLED